MKKIIILIVATVLCLSTLLTGCGTGFKNTITNFGDAKATSNGGFAVVKDGYVYYINGVEVNTADNTYGEVKKGALVRTKVDDLGKPNAAAEMVIPALFVTGSYSAGFFIYGNFIYYASPRSEKNKEGDVENSKLDFFKTSFDGKKSTNLVTADDNTTNFRFIEVDDVVYLVLETVNEDNVKILKVINTNTEKVVWPQEQTEEQKEKGLVPGKIESVIFAENSDNLDANIYFTRVAYDETLKKDKSYNEIYRLVLGAEVKEELVVSGKGAYESENEEKGFGIQGAKFSLVRDIKNAVIVKADFVETDVTTVTHYYAIEKANDNYVLVNDGTKAASQVFAATSKISYNEGKVTAYYLDATLGLMKYGEGKEVNDYREVVFYDKDLIGYTVQFWTDEYVYLTDSNSFYYRVKYVEPAADETVAVEQITCIASSTSWYLPEIVGGYFLSVYTANPYMSMVFARENKAFAKDEEGKSEEIETIQTESIAQYQENLELRLGIATEEMEESILDYYKNTFSEEEYNEYFK